MDILKNKTLTVWVLASLLFLALSYLPMFASPPVMDAFTREDRIYESLSSIYLFVTSVCFAVAFLRTRVPLNIKDPKWIRSMIFLGMAVIFFLAAGEEISWGQRILGFEPPNLIKEHNVQKEFTFHNLDLFQGENHVFALDFDQMASLFALAFGAGIPLAVWFIRWLGRRLEPIFPVLPVQTSILFLGNYIIQKILVRIIPIFPQLYHNPGRNFRVPLIETREHGYEFALMVAALVYVFVKLRTPAEEASSSQAMNIPGEAALADHKKALESE